MPTNRKPKPTMKTKPLTLEQIEEGERLCREAVDRLRRSRTEPLVVVYCPRQPGEVWTGYAPGIANSLQDQERKAIAEYCVDNLPALLASARRELAMQQQLAELESSFRTTASVLSDRSVAGAWLEAADRIDQLRKGEG